MVPQRLCSNKVNVGRLRGLKPFLTTLLLCFNRTDWTRTVQAPSSLLRRDMSIAGSQAMLGMPHEHNIERMPAAPKICPEIDRWKCCCVAPSDTGSVNTFLIRCYSTRLLTSSSIDSLTIAQSNPPFRSTLLESGMRSKIKTAVWYSFSVPTRLCQHKLRHSNQG